MSKPDDLPLYLALYKLLKYLYDLVGNFRREHKYTLGQSILNLGWETLDFVILANCLPNKEKAPEIRKASAAFDKLKIRLRMAYELKIISHKKYGFLIKQNEEVGKMLAGWLKWAVLETGGGGREF